MGSIAERRAADLTPRDQARLHAAHRSLRDAVSRYFEVSEPLPLADGEVPALDPANLRQAQEDVERAESSLWRLRADLLGWERHPSDLSALQVRDWFDDEVDDDP